MEAVSATPFEWGAPCANCDNRRCMACALGGPHETCHEDCPGCCNAPLFDEFIHTTDEESYDR